jgi:hypothetical protein
MRKIFALFVVAAFLFVGSAFATEPFVQLNHTEYHNLIDLEKVSPDVFDHLTADSWFFNKTTDGLDGTVFNGLENDVSADMLKWLRSNDY